MKARSFLNDHSYPNFPTANGYLTEIIRSKYIDEAIASGALPNHAHRMPEIITLSASNDARNPIQFWQLYSVLGQDPIVEIVSEFYQRVFSDEEWFRSVFSRVGNVNHHINTQASMWIDVMGGGPYYHGAEFRLSFHHTHNAHQLMNEKGANLWIKLMVETLDTSPVLKNIDPRVRPSLNTFLTHFVGKYAADFGFQSQRTFGEVNPAMKRKINFLNMTSDAIEALSEDILREGLVGRDVDVTSCQTKQDLVNKALSL